MIRGQRLFNELNQLEAPVKKDAKRGRDEALLNDRNECLLYRYYYYSKIIRMSFIDIVPILGKEFFLKRRTIEDTISKSADKLRDIYKERLTANELAKKFLFYNWKNN